MKHVDIKTEVLEIKLKLHLLKNRVPDTTLAGDASEAAINSLQNRLQELKTEVARQIYNIRHAQGDVKDFLYLNSLLFEFRQLDLETDFIDAETIDMIDQYVNRFWLKKDEMYLDLMTFLLELYNQLLTQVTDFRTQNDHKRAKQAVERIQVIAELVQKLKP